MIFRHTKLLLVVVVNHSGEEKRWKNKKVKLL